MARQQRSEYLDRLRHADRLDSWQPADLHAALRYLDELNTSRMDHRHLPTVDIRLAIYRGRVQRELRRRSAEGGDVTGLQG